MSRVEITTEQIKVAQGGDSDAMWEIVQAFDPMFSSMIRSVAPGASREDAEDLLQEARAVLIERLRDYDSDFSSAKLTSFVYQSVKRRIAEEHINMTTLLAVDPTTVLRVRRALWEKGGDIERAYESVSSAADSRNCIERERFMAIVEALAGTDSLDATVGNGDEGEGLTLSDVIADPSSDVSVSLERRDYARWLMTQIPARQSLALRAYYGVNMTAMADAEACMQLQVRPATLRRLRSDGMASARRAAGRWDCVRARTADTALPQAA